MGIYFGKVPNRPGLVVLFILAAWISEPGVWPGSGSPGIAHHRGISGLDGGINRRRLDLRGAGEARLAFQPRARDGYVDLRISRDFGNFRGHGAWQHVAGRGAGWRGYRRASGLVGQLVYPGFGS